MCYIKGGKPAGATKTYKGCDDKTPPLAQKAMKIQHELYFAKSASVWSGGGVCFIHPDKSEKEETLGKMYLITRQQFLDVVQQENSAEDSIEIDFQKARHEKSLLVSENSWYGKLLFLGEKEDAPILTFTNENFLAKEINAPNHHYLATIMKGLIETHLLNQLQLESYFLAKKGIDKGIMEAAIKTL
jgi:hypothetical protein